MPPPAKPSSKNFLLRPDRIENCQHSSPFFARTEEDRATQVPPDIAQKRRLESNDEIDKPSILPEQANSTNKRNSKDSRGNINVRFEADKGVKDFAMQGVIREGHENLSDVGPGQRAQLPSTDLDYAEGRLYDRVSREEASTFVSAKIYRQSVEKRRKLGD